MVNLSREEITSLGNYLYANYLIIQCKDAALRVSAQTWEAIEDRMLLPPGNWGIIKIDSQGINSLSQSKNRFKPTKLIKNADERHGEVN